MWWQLCSTNGSANERFLLRLRSLSSPFCLLGRVGYQPPKLRPVNVTVSPARREPDPLLTLLRDDSTEVEMVTDKLLGMPTIVTVSPRSLAAGGVEVTDRASCERSVRPIGDVEAEPRGAA